MDYIQKPESKDDPAMRDAVTLRVNGKQVGSGAIPHFVPSRFSATETLDIGSDLGSTVSESCVALHIFTGKIKKVEIDLK
jgi:arylsulfatase